MTLEVPEALRRFAPPVGRVLARHPDLLPAVRRRELPGRDALAEEVRALAASPDEATLLVGMRRLKYRVVGALVLWDLGAGPAGVDRVGEVLSDLADALIEAALRFSAPEDGPDVVVLAMGKHGARELNYASDVDLVFVARSSDGEARMVADRQLRFVVKAMSQVTPDGFCFRVDLNLRPEGRTGAPVTSLPAAEHWFLTYGRTWERAAWLKARPAAGDLALGDELLRSIEPFRFRRHLDFGTLDDLAAMRDRIAAAARQDALARDLKRGPGGIREIEFLVQATQLAWCGRDPELRVPATVPALRALADKGVLPVEAEQVVDDYRFLRALEHRVQWEREGQTQMVPSPHQTEAWDRLAATLGERDGDALQERLLAVRSRVEEAWRAVFATEEELDAITVVDPFATVDEQTSELEALGFADPATAAERLARLAQPGAWKRMRPSTWRRFERVAPRLTTLAARSGNPDEALRHIERFVERVGARGTTYELLHENPAVMQTLVRLFADSALLSERLITHPELLDALVLRGRGGETPPRGLDALVPELERELALREDEQEGLLALRTTQTVELLRIGLADLAGALDDLPSRWLTALAQALVVGADRIATRTMEGRHGVPKLDGEELPHAIVGLGSLGSGWMTYGSDVDLLFVHGDGFAESEGPRPLDGRTWMARHAQRTATALSAQTREGRCYEVDLRLRPGGGGGAVVTSLGGLAGWYRDRAANWERLVMARSRVVCASTPAFAAQVTAVLEEARRAPGGADALAQEAAAMRARQLEELAAERDRVLDLKLGLGGLTDVEFAVAVAQQDMEGAARVQADPVQALDGLPVSSEEREELRRGYRFLREIEGALRLRTGTDAAWLRLDDPATGRVAAALGLDVSTLEVKVRETRTRHLEILEPWRRDPVC